MEEKSELNDIILNKNTSSTNNKKIVLAVATLGIILIVVVMLMNTITSKGTDNLPQAILPPAPEIKKPKVAENEPLFEEVPVVQDGTQNGDSLEKIAQKLKEESSKEVMQNVVPQEIANNNNVEATPTSEVTKKEKIKESIPPVHESMKKEKAKDTQIPKDSIKKEKIKESVPPVNESIKKEEAKDIHAPKEAVKKEKVKDIQAPKEVVKKEKVKDIQTSKEIVKKKEIEETTKSESSKIVIKPSQELKSSSNEIYYVQVGSFMKNEPNKNLLESVGKLGYKYKFHKVKNDSTELSKVLVGPFGSDKEAREALKALRGSVEPGAFLTKIQ